MTLRRTYAIAAAGVAAALVAVPVSASAVEDDDPSTGTVTVTRFDDRYPDGVFDTTKTSVGGDVDRINSDLSANLIDVNGDRHYASAEPGGDYVFENVPVGPATVYLTAPNQPARETFFDATDAASADDIELLPIGEYFGEGGMLSVDVDADGEHRLVGMTSLRLAASVRYADGTVASGVSVELGANGQWYPATEYAFAGGYGTYEAFDAPLLPDEFGVRLTAPEGYRIAGVTAGNSPDSQTFDVTQHDGAYWFSTTQVLNYFWNPSFTVTLEALPDTVRPQVTLVAPTTAGPFQSLSLQVDATDAGGLQRIVANIYKDGKLFKSTQSAIGGATAGTHTAGVKLPDGDYTLRYNAQDLAGNISTTGTLAFTIDSKAPKATVKDGSSFTVKSGNGYDLISFKLSDAGEIDKVSLNGTVKDLTDDVWSDVNFIRPGVFGAVQGKNTLVVYDVAGNTRTIEFTLN